MIHSLIAIKKKLPSNILDHRRKNHTDLKKMMMTMHRRGTVLYSILEHQPSCWLSCKLIVEEKERCSLLILKFHGNHGITQRWVVYIVFPSLAYGPYKVSSWSCDGNPHFLCASSKKLLSSPSPHKPQNQFTMVLRPRVRELGS